ncbi:MAG: efflux RND transporter periplasmic adaptor subunit [Nitrospinae bacterium]|nr:efflux RND transporter periplasmic adaptor subunit [Nitrospinota bacterium]
MNSADYRKRFFVTLALAVAIAGLYFLRHEIAGLFAAGHGPAQQAAVQPAKERKIKYWTDPMDPAYTAQGPGKSPMGMELVPVYEDDTAGGGIRIRPEVQQNIGVRTQKAKVRPVSRTVRASGVVAFDERKVTNVQAKVSGWVEKLFVNFTGEKVKKGDYLLELYSPELVATEEEFLLAVKNRDAVMNNKDLDLMTGGEAMYQAARKRLQYLDVPEHQIWDIEWKKEVLKTLHIHSPFDGVVVGKMVSAGLQVGPGMTLYTIADLSTVWVMADVYEYEIGWVKTGDRASITVPAYPGRTFTGRVAFIAPVLERETRTVKVRLEFANPRGDLKPEMFAAVDIRPSERPKAVTVPKEAVIRGGKRDVVIVALGGGLFSPREVRLGVEGEGYYEITNGVAEGDEVVTSAQFLIDSESNLREATNKMLSHSHSAEPAPQPAPAAPADHSGMKMDGMEGMPMEHEGHTGMEGMEHMDHSGMKMEGMEMPSEPAPKKHSKKKPKHKNHADHAGHGE